MPLPPNLISPAPSSSPSSPATSAGPPEQQRTSHWLQRADLFVRVIVQLYVGLILVFFPWTAFWTYNRFLLYYAPISKVMETGAMRGVVSGLGLLNLWIAISEAIHYKED